MDKPVFNAEEFEASLVTKVMNGVSEFFAKKDKEVSSEALETSVKEISNSIKDEVVNSFSISQSEKETELQNKVYELEANVSELETKIAANSAVVVDVVASSDPEPQPNKASVVDSENVKVMKSIFKNLTPSEKLILNNK